MALFSFIHSLNTHFGTTIFEPVALVLAKKNFKTENDNDFSMRWGLIKGYFSRRCEDKYKEHQSVSRLNKGEQGVWQRRFWEHQIRDEVDFTRHVEYIHYNPVKHGVVNSPNAWPYSSFHRYVKQGIYDSDWGVGTEIKFDEEIGYE